MLSGHSATIWPIRSAVAGALPCLAEPMVRRMPRSTAFTASLLVGGSWPAILWALGQMAALVEVAAAARGNLRALAVLNLADPGSSPDIADAAAAVGDFPRSPCSPR